DARDRELLLARVASDELSPIAPPRLLRQLCPPDPDDLEGVCPDQRDMFGPREDSAPVGGQAFELLERLPPRLDGRQCPAAAGGTDRPEPAAQRFVRDSLPEWQVLQPFV